MSAGEWDDHLLAAYNQQHINLGTVPWTPGDQLGRWWVVLVRAGGWRTSLFFLTFCAGLCWQLEYL